MQKKLSNMSLKEFDRFLKFAKKKEILNKFKVILKGGIDIFYNGRKVAMIYHILSSTKEFNHGDVILNTDLFDRKMDISSQERIKLGEEIWEELTVKYREQKEQ